MFKKNVYILNLEEENKKLKKDNEKLKKDNENLKCKNEILLISHRDLKELEIKMKTMRLKTDSENEEPNYEELEYKYEETILCRICETNLKEVLLVPCNHVFGCFECMEKYKKDICPVCRTKIIFREKIFM